MRSSTSQNNNFFEYISGQWIHDETWQMSCRQFGFEQSVQACGQTNKIFNIKLIMAKKSLLVFQPHLLVPSILSQRVRSQLWTIFAHTLEYQYLVFLPGSPMRSARQSSRSTSLWKRLRESSWAASGVGFYRKTTDADYIRRLWKCLLSWGFGTSKFT
jgi:hypothetical protein